MALVQTRTTPLQPIPRRTAMLSERELDVMQAIGDRCEVIRGREMLAISLNTVRTHLKKILVKTRCPLEARKRDHRHSERVGSRCAESP